MALKQKRVYDNHTVQLQIKDSRLLECDDVELGKFPDVSKYRVAFIFKGKQSMKHASQQPHCEGPKPREFNYVNARMFETI